MTKEEVKTAIQKLIQKSTEATSGGDAQGFAQAAQTLAFVLQPLRGQDVVIAADTVRDQDPLFV
jgi:hypothetical protein